MTPEELMIRQKLKDDYIHYSAKCLKIRSKSGSIDPFIINKEQQYIHQKVEEQRARTGKVRAIILKARQMGCSSYIEGRFYWRVTHHKGMRAFILTHEEEATNNLFEMAKRFHDSCPNPVRPTTKTSNAKELIFDGLDSGYKLGTAGNKSVGRSSTIQFLHASEAAFFKHAEEHAKGIMQTVPDSPNTEIFIESTANGIGNWFHQQWQLAEAGQSDFIPIFVPWYWHNSYSKEFHPDFKHEEDEIEIKDQFLLSDEQIYWRRLKIRDLSVSGIDGAKAFNQEYPSTASMAFVTSGEDNFISNDIVMKARKTRAEPYGPIVAACDPARFGDDRTSIAVRQGRVIKEVVSYTKKDTMEVVGILIQLLKKYPDLRYLYIDVGGLGAGVYDRMVELGHKEMVVSVNAGSRPLNAERYFNKRAEMWGEFKEWLKDEPCQIPDLDSLHSDITGIKYKIDSNSRLKMESKEEMKKRGVRSCDEADACCMTLYHPPSALTYNKQEQYSKVAKNITSVHRKVMDIRKQRQ